MANGLRFDERVINAGFHIEQPVITANLRGDGRHVIVAGRDSDHVQHLAVYAVNEPDSPVASLQPGTHLIAYDVGHLGDQDALYFIEPGRIVRYDLDAGTFNDFLEIQTIYGQRRSGKIVTTSSSRIRPAIGYGCSAPTARSAMKWYSRTAVR